MTIPRLLLLTAVLSAAPALGACGDDDDYGGDGGSPSNGASGAVQVSETEYAIETVGDIAAGSVTFEVTNDGEVTHALEVKGDGIEEETDDIAPGESAALELEITDGTYELYCPIADHKDRGMTAEFGVGSGAGGGSSDDSGDGSSDDSGSEDQDSKTNPGGY